MPTSPITVMVFFLGPLLKAPGAIRPALSNLLPSSAAVAICSAHRDSGQLAHVPVRRAACANSEPNATDLPPLPSEPLSWERNEKQLIFPVLPTLNNECPNYSMGSCDEDVHGG